MIDIRALREDPDGVKAALARRGVEPSEVDAVLAADVAHRARLSHAEALRAEVKTLSRAVGEAKKSGDEARAEALRAQSRRLDDEQRAAAAEAEVEWEKVHQGLLYLPNIPAPRSRAGTATPTTSRSAAGGPARPAALPSRCGATSRRCPTGRSARRCNCSTWSAGARLSGSMFPLYRGAGARLLRALTAFALDRHTPTYEEIRPPTMVLTETMVSTGHLPKFADDAYHLERDDLWAIPTAEVPLTSMHRGEILDESVLPLRFTAATACYRREAGSAGRDTRGLAAGARVRQGGAVRVHHAGAGARRPGRHPAPGRVAAAGARALLPGDGPVHGRPRRSLGPHVRPGGLLARASTSGSR